MKVNLKEDDFVQYNEERHSKPSKAPSPIVRAKGMAVEQQTEVLLTMNSCQAFHCG